MEWSANYQFIADDPLKISMKEGDAHRAAVGAFVLTQVEAAQSALAIISPYFVPGDKGSTRSSIWRARQEGRDTHQLPRGQRCCGGNGGYSRYRTNYSKRVHLGN